MFIETERYCNERTKTEFLKKSFSRQQGTNVVAASVVVASVADPTVGLDVALATRKYPQEQQCSVHAEANLRRPRRRLDAAQG